MLDNPIWNSLLTRHSHLARVAGDAKRYPAEVTPFIAVKSGQEASGLHDLVAPGESVGILNVIPPLDEESWEPVHAIDIHQYVWRAGDLPPSPDIRPLERADIPAMIELTGLVYPAYFRAETALLGDYFGVVIGGQLCAMGGIRMAMDGHQELSAICTHPDSRGKGYAAQVTAHLVRHVVAQNDVAFLHTEFDNHSAQRLYEGLGFELHQVLPFRVMKKR